MWSMSYVIVYSMLVNVNGIYYVHVCEQARWARSAGNSAIENLCIIIIINMHNGNVQTTGICTMQMYKPLEYAQRKCTKHWTMHNANVQTIEICTM